MKKLLLLFTYFLTIFLSLKCKVSKPPTNEGEAIELVRTLWHMGNNKDTPNITIKERAWYQDSIGITELCRINFVETDTSKYVYISTTGYRFVNLKQKRVYEYTSFSDTAALKRKYRYTDTTEFIAGWNFTTKPRIGADSLTQLTDTLIDKTVYARCKFEEDLFNNICWFRCDKKNMYFTLSREISDRIGCPVFFFSSYPIKNPDRKHEQKINLISQRFPDSVQKVFNAWKKNEVKYPIE